MDTNVLSDRQYLSDLLSKERYLSAMASNLELMITEAKRFPIRYKYTPQEEQQILVSIDKKIKSIVNVDSLEKVYQLQNARMDSSKKAYEILVQQTPKKTEQELDKDQVARENYKRLERARNEVEDAEKASKETGKQVERLKIKVQQTREALEKFMLEGKKKLAIILRDYSRVGVQDFGYQGNNKTFYNFSGKTEYDRFLQYARFYAISNEYRATRKALLDVIDDNLKKRLFEIEVSTATKFYERGDYATAINYFDDIKESYSDLYGEIEDLTFTLAEANFGLGRYAEAKAHYESLIKKYSGPEYAELNFLDKTEQDIKRLESEVSAHKDSMNAVKRQYQALIAAAKARGSDVAGYSLRQINQQIEIIDEEIRLANAQLFKLRKQFADVQAERQKGGVKNVLVSKAAPYRQQSMYRILFMSYAYNDSRQFSADMERFKSYLRKNDIYSNKSRVLAATIEYLEKRYESAIDWARQVPEDSEMRNDADYIKGLAYLETQNTDQAVESFGKIIARQEGLFENQHNFIRNAALIQLGNISYTKANLLIQEARKIVNADQEASKKVDSTLQVQFRRYIRSKQASGYDRQLARILERITSQDTLIESLSSKLGSELLELSISERDLQRLSYALQTKGEKIDQANKDLQKIQSDLETVQREGKVASDRLSRMREALSRMQAQVAQARFDLYQKFAQAEYAKAEDYFERVDRNYVGKDIAKLGTLWAKFRQKKENEVKTEIDQYARTFRTSDNLYETMFLSGYIKHIKDPTNADMIMREYDFVYNGMMAFDFADKFLEQKSILRQQKTLTDAIVATSNSPNEIDLSARVSVIQEQVLDLLALDRTVLSKANNNDLLPAERKTRLQSKLEEMKQVRASIPATMKNLSNATEKSQAALDKLLKMSVQTISDETHLFAKHAPVLVAGEKADYQRNLEFYKKIARDEFVRAEKQEKMMQTGKTVGDQRKKLLNAYYEDNASLQKNQSNTIETILAQREFFGTRTIERAGVSAQYALNSLMYNEIQKSRTQIQNYERVVGSFRNAVKKKIGQLEYYLNQIDLESTGDKDSPITKSDLLQQEFNGIFSDFRKSFFIGTDYLKFSNAKEQKNVQVP